MKKNKWLMIGLLLLASAITFSLTAWMAAYGHTLRFYAGGISYLLIVYTVIVLTSKNVRPWAVLVIFAWPVTLFLLIKLMQQSYLSIPSSTAILAGTVAGWGMYRLQLRNRILLLIVFSLTVYFAADPVYDKLLFRMNFGPNGGKANEPIPASALLTTDSTAVQFGDKIVLLDFWNTTCGVCYRTFPQVQEVWKRYANHPKVAVYSVNIPVRNEQFSSQLRRLSQYDFPQLLAIRNEQAKEYGVVAYPTVLVVHNQHILYRGDLEQGVELVESILATP